MSTHSAAIENGQRLAASLRELDLGSPRIAFVLGSGLGAFAGRIENAQVVPYSGIDGMPQSSVPGHEGRLVCGDSQIARNWAPKVSSLTKLPGWHCAPVSTGSSGRAGL